MDKTLQQLEAYIFPGKNVSKECVDCGREIPAEYDQCPFVGQHGDE